MSSQPLPTSNWRPPSDSTRAQVQIHSQTCTSETFPDSSMGFSPKVFISTRPMAFDAHRGQTTESRCAGSSLLCDFPSLEAEHKTSTLVAQECPGGYTNLTLASEMLALLPSCSLIPQNSTSFLCKTLNFYFLLGLPYI